MAVRLTWPLYTRFDGNGKPVSGAQLFFYEAGTTTKLDTFSDEDLTNPNDNPMVADGNGEFGDIFLQLQDYKLILTSATDTDPPTGGKTFDPVQGNPVVSGDDFKATPQSPPDMTVLVSTGNLFDVVAKTLVVKTAQTSALIVAPTTNPRRDIIHIDRLTAVIGVTTGAEAPSPVDPTIADDKLPIARITLATTTTQIDDALITDIRELNLLGSGDVVRFTFVDEDDMASNSAVKLPSQQSVKAYTDANSITRGSIDGLILSNGTDADHDIDIAAGVARDGGDAANMALASVLVKKIDAGPFVVGTNQAGNDQAQLDGAQTVTFNDNGGSPDDVTIDAGTWTVTPSVGDTLVVVGGTNAGSYQVTAATTTVINVATGSFTADAASASAIHTVKINTWYHCWLIRRSDTGVVDFLFSESATAPTLPTSYDQKRRIGAVLTDGSANIILFKQFDDEFVWDVPVQEYRATTVGTAAVTRTLAVPTGLIVQAIHISGVSAVAVATEVYGLITSLDQTDSTPSSSLYHVSSESSGEGTNAVTMRVRTNTSSQIRTRADQSAANIRIFGHTVGWVDPRGRNA